ncbi:VWA domain-containing protein [Galbibacter sp. EGI 63066]|uniref:VWA domain-containing protein n=1 Tax=Galbibacter sp. EGI 63066 TaxID=2993559 RepID=UPI002249431B|nr:VWA domain-containing protein [Galbibacter sp. EGI 63066]MCX2680781.1 VWA domain-containing protein [Galbibacter sp. EGI 63066]
MLENHMILYAVLAAVIALLIAFFQYRKQLRKSVVYRILAFLRFLSVFTILLLLISPKYNKKTYYTEKPGLTILADNSSSIRYLGYDSIVKDIIRTIEGDDELNDRFDIKTLSFGGDIKAADNLNFSEPQTNIAKALQSLESIDNEDNGAVLLLTDGNQTYGSDYQYSSRNYKKPVFPIVLGDSTQYNDLKVAQLNVNKYAYLKNEFPVEVFLNYEGEEQHSSVFSIYQGRATVYSKRLNFSPEKNTQVLNIELPAKAVGVQTYRAEITPLDQEKNKDNNSKLFAVEVIDQKTDVAIVTDVRHPDIGVLKKIVESNEYRKATIENVRDGNLKSTDFQLFILYQPNHLFSDVFQELLKQKSSYWVISGVDTDWNFLNKMELGYLKQFGRSEEEILPGFNPNFSVYQVDDIDFENFPPLTKSIGDIDFLMSYHTLLYQRIGNVSTETPLLAVMEDNGTKSALLAGEGIWKWRSVSFLEDKNTEDFDAYFGKLIQYLSSTEKRERLSINHESFYYGNSTVVISAAYFDKNFVFDPNASLEIVIKNKTTGETKIIPMLLKGNNYEVDLSSFGASAYDFTVRVLSANLSRSGSFTILEYDVEKQFLNADIDRLRSLSENTGGVLFFSGLPESLASGLSALKEELMADIRFQSIQKSKENVVPLVNWKWLLIVIVVALATEWFIRKYNGLI